MIDLLHKSKPLLSLPLIHNSNENSKNQSIIDLNLNLNLKDEVASTIDSHRSTASDLVHHYSNIELERAERIKLCGNLFERRKTVNEEMIHEFFRREKCLYSK
jgi:hypothetical protein